MNANPVLVEVLRGGTVESWHRGAFAVVDADGKLLASAGDVERPVFPRSAVKLLQALPMVESGAPDRLGLDDRELALACASHQGEAVHEATAASMLAKAGVDHTALECGVHWPYAESAQHALVRAGREPCALHNNCSGKHAGFVCLAHALAAGRELRGFLSGYVGREHPVMREVSAALAATTGWDLASSACGTDGCSIPTHAVPLHHLALAFARVGTGHGLGPARAAAARRLRQAIARAPLMVAGTGKFDTVLMERLGERVCCKVGAEGVYCASLPERGLGVAVKMDDGNNARGCEVVLAALLRALLPLDLVERDFVEALAQPRLFNRRGLEIGGLRPTAAVAA